MILLDFARMKKRFSVALLTISLVIPPVFAEKTAKAPFSIAERHGSITDIYAGTEKLPKQWVMIQDLHANVGVQKNIAAVLYRLQER